MRQAFRSHFLPILFVLGGLTAAGCGGGAKPRGQLLVNGQPYKLTDGERVAVSFTPAGPGKTAAAATVSQDGSFAVEGDGLQPGSYSISVISNNPKVPGEAYKDKFNNAFNGASSPLKIDVEGSSSSLAIDLGAQTVTKK